MSGRVLVVEDDSAVSGSVRRLLGRHEYQVRAVSSAEAAVALLDLDPAFDIILMDVTLPGQDGYACCRALRSMGHKQPIIMLTARRSVGEKITGLRSGADDYLTKPFDGDELLARVRAQVRRSQDYSALQPIESHIHLGDGLLLDREARDAFRDGTPLGLTGKEFDVLALLARTPNVAIERGWIYEQIWGCAWEDSVKLLAVTIHRLRLKLEPAPEAPRHILNIRGYGYKLSIHGRPHLQQAPTSTPDAPSRPL